MVPVAARGVLVAVLVLSGFVLLDSTGHAQPSGCEGGSEVCSGAEAGQGRVTFGAREVDLTHVTEGGRGSRGSEPPCTYRSPGPNFTRRYAYRPSEIPMWAVFYWMDCGERTYLRWYVDRRSDPVGDGLLTEAVQAAFDTIVADVPILALSPSADRVQLTGMPTLLAIDPASLRPIDGSVTAGEVTVRAHLRPRAVLWDLGNGERRRCPHPGSAIPTASGSTATRTASGSTVTPDRCSYTYLRTSPVGAEVEDGGATVGGYPLSAQVAYDAGYHVTGPVAAGEYALGEVLGPPATARLTVRELRAVRIAD